MDKHLPYFEMTKACERPGCPLCTLVRDRTARYLDNLLFEHVSDRPFRAQFRASGGFCAEHADALANYRDGLAVAILYRDIFTDQLLELGKAKKATKAFRTQVATASPWKKSRMASAPCGVCVERDRIENEYLGLLAEAAEEPELEAAFAASDGLCVAHYQKLARNHKNLPAWLIAYHERRYAELLARVSRFIELSAYGHQEEFEALSQADKLVWKELLEISKKRRELLG
jgi:hypothetical protein